MTSSMLAGERRWASARRGGMTVLGKVAVPKPLNLPSQRLENHGLDPNVEIVPKGTLSWGSRSSSSATNAWGSSTLSPNADGGTGSPSHLSGRPSSGGSGTRPSTAGSDRMHEPTANVWGPNSRPSSASGALTSSQTPLTSLRPRSAETRPGSSQLSRFAEPSSDNSVAWGPTGTAEKLGVTSSKNDGFSLSSGDFPTLGSEREHSGKHIESQDNGSHGCPSSSSGTLTPAKERTGASQDDVKSGTVNTWKRDGSQHIEDGIQPSSEKWHGDPQQYLNANVPPQHFDTWHGPPINAPPGVWYRGPPGGPPYGTPIAPGGFPIEPFPYYRPQLPPTALANSQPVPPPGTGPRGPRPKNGDLYRPQMPDAFIRPGMPIRPGFYPGPVAYEGFYGPPMGYCNSNERDIPFMGMPPPVYNRYPAQNAPDPTHPHARAGGRVSTGKILVSEQGESGHSEDTRGPYKVLLKQHNEWDGKEKEDNWENTAPANVLSVENPDQPRKSSWKNEWGADHSREEDMYSTRTTLGENSSSRTLDDRGGYSLDFVKVKSSESMGNVKEVDDSWAKKSDIAASSFPEVPQIHPATPKDSTLIQKIEGLNAKARASDGRHDIASTLSREVQKSSLQDVNAKVTSPMSEGGTAPVWSDGTHSTGNAVPASINVGVSTGDKTLQPTAPSGAAISRRANHGMQGRVEHRGKGRFNTQDADEWRKKPLAAESSSAISGINSRPASDVHAQDHHTFVVAAEKTQINPPAKDEGESFTPMFDPSDCQAQRAKMRELAKQRSIQLQKEEEERTREQRAKALAKLEELNRRTHSLDGSTQKLEKALPSDAIQQKQEESKMLAESVIDETKYEAQNSNLVSISNVVAQKSENSSSGVGKSMIPSRDSLLETPRNAQQDSAEPCGQSLPVKLDDHNAVADCKPAAQVNDSSASRHKRTGYKPKQHIPSEKNLTERSIPMSMTEAQKDHTDIAVNDVAFSEVVPGEVGSSCESSLPNVSNVMVESSAHQRRKNNRSGKNKHKLDESSSVTALSSPVTKETTCAKVSTDSGKPITSQMESDPSSVQSVTDVNNTVKPSEQRFSVLSEDAHGRGSSQWKSCAKVSTDSGKPMISQMESDPSSIQSVTDVNNTVRPSEQRFSVLSEEAHGRGSSQWKSQHSRRMPRNPQANRLQDKFHSNEAVVWAPVRMQNKTEVADEASQKTVPDAVTSTAKSDNLVQNSPKSKRAEMERYVPKPVAKELAQQGSMQQPVPSSFSQTSSNETVARVEPGFQSAESSQPESSVLVNVGSTAEFRGGDSKQNKHAKPHGAWRQRGSTESPQVMGMQHGSSSTSVASRKIQKSMDQHKSSKPDVISLKAEPKCSDEWNTSDGWISPDNSDAVAPITSVVKDHGVTGKGKRHPFKGHRGNNPDVDHKNINRGETDKTDIQSATPEISQTDRAIASKDSRGTSERTSSHWQPKSQAYSANNKRGSRSSGGQNVAAEVGKNTKKDSPPQGRVHRPPQLDTESNEITAQHHPDQSASENKNVSEAPNLGHQEARRERKVASSKGRPYSPNQGPPSTDNPAPSVSMDTRNEQRFPSGFRKNGHQNNRPGIGQESRGDWSSAGQDNRQHNREKHRHNSHYEYQPVGPYNNNESNNFEGPTDGSHNTGSRYRERGQGHSKRGGGNFYGRHSGAIRVDAGYD